MLKILLDFIWDFTFGLWGIGSTINYVQEGLPGLQSSFLSMIFNFESLITQAGVSFVTLIVEIDEYAILFVIVKFVKKILDVYGLQTDGDANGDILVLITNFFKAMVVAISFTLIWSWLSEIFIQFITDISGDYNVFATTGLDTLKQIGEQGKDTPLYWMIPVYFIGDAILTFLQLINAAELWVLRLGIPIACCGLLDADQGVFKQYIRLISKVILTIVVQFLCLNISLYIISHASAGQGAAATIVACVAGFILLLVAFRTPKLFGDLLIQKQGGSAMQMAYLASTMIRFV